MRIGSRLTFSFAVVALLMALGSVVAFWQFHRVRAQAQRLYQVDMQAQTVMRVHTNVLTFRQNLDLLLETQDVDRFAADAAPRRQDFRNDVDRAIQAVSVTPADVDRHQLSLRTLEIIRHELPAQIDAVVALARASEWKAVRRRLDNQVKKMTRNTASLTEEIDREVRREQDETLENIRRVQREAVWTLALTGLLTLLTAAGLGLGVTRSITRPLARLDSGAQALARGEFEHKVSLAGHDELASLGGVFNQTAAHLQDLYGALRRSEEHFRSLIEHASDLIMVLSPEGTVSYVSPSCRRVVGYAPEAVIGRDLFELVPLGPAATRLRSLLKGPGALPGVGTPIEFLFRHSHGSTLVLEAIATNLLEDPAVAGVVVNCRDVTERRHAEEALRASEERYRAVYEDTPSMYFTVADDGTVASVNQFGAAYLGYAVPDLVDQSVLQVFLEEDKPAASRHLADCLAHPEQVFAWELRKVRKDGSLLWVKETARAVHERDGRLVVLIACEDVTERKRAEEAEAALRSALKKAAAEWELTFDSIESPMLIVDARGRVSRLNRAARELAGAPYRDLIHRAVADMAPGQPWQQASLVAALAARSRRAAQAQVQDAETGRTWDLTAGPSTGPTAGAVPEEERVIVVARDVTRMIELQESLRRSETMSAMGTLVAGVAHEVRNPLFSISANLDAFEAQYGHRSEYKEAIDLLRAETTRLATLMNDLLDYGRPAYETPSPEPFPDVVAQAVGACASLARQRGVSVVHRMHPDLPPVLMDRKRMAQVLQNLLENAIQHSPAGSEVVIEAAEQRAEGRRWVDCSVTDKGPGFVPDDLPRIFEPFFTRRRGGTGLGLSIVQRIVDLHGGTVVATNRPAGGATMTVRLPHLGPAEREGAPLLAGEGPIA
jgi:PAS domain S-box-containing protein